MDQAELEQHLAHLMELGMPEIGLDPHTSPDINGHVNFR